MAGLDEGSRWVRVDLGPRSYEIRIVTDQLSALGPFARARVDRSWSAGACRNGLIVTDSNLTDRAGPVRETLLASGIDCQVAVVPAGEPSKRLAVVSDLYDRLIDLRADRHTLIVAVGGGVVGDLAGFLAATYMRGLPLLMLPTSLLAQVDSSVGGKVGVNHPRAKNVIGAFHQPVGVWVDTAVLQGLPPREFRCGLAEVVKYGAILDADFLAWIERSVDAILAQDPAALRSIVARCCELKADVVSKDEREETGLRAVLNFGHTIGHAIEAVAGYGGDYLHGEAVAVGMVAECRIAERLGWIGPDSTDRLASLLERLGLPIAAPGPSREALIEAMGRDKKNQGGKVRFVLPRELGRVELTDRATLDDVRAVLS